MIDIHNCCINQGVPNWQFYNCGRNEKMKSICALCTFMIIYCFGLVRSESSMGDGHSLKLEKLATTEGEVFHLQLNAPFNGRLLPSTDYSTLLGEKRHKRNVIENAPSPSLVVNKVVMKENQSKIQNSTEPEELPVPEAIRWSWNDRPEDSRRSRIPNSLGRTEIPFNQKRRAPSRVIDDDIAYIMPQDFSEDNDFYRYQQSRTKASIPRRRKVKNRPRLPPDEDVYSLYSAGRPYRRSRTRPPKNIATYSPPQSKGDTIISSLINTGSDFLKMFNPFNLFGSSETEEPPPTRYHYREREVPRYHENYPPSEELPEKEDLRDPNPFYPERHRPYGDEADVDDNYKNLRTSSPKLRSRFRNKPSPDFNRDESLTDYDYGYDDYEVGSRNYKTKSSSLRMPEYEPRNFGDERSYLRRKYPSYDINYDFNFGKEKRSDGVKYSNEIFQNIDDTHTLDYLKEFPLRDDLYVAKDGNIYLKESKSHKNDLLGLDMYGMEYPEYVQESKQYSQLKAAYVKPSRSSLKKSGREMNLKDINDGNIERLLQNELIKEKQEPENKSGHPHSNFALEKLTPTKNMPGLS